MLAGLRARLRDSSCSILLPCDMCDILWGGGWPDEGLWYQASVCPDPAELVSWKVLLIQGIERVAG